MLAREVSVRLGCFGGLSWKPLALKGQWKGLTILGMMQKALWPKMKDRQCYKVSKPSGRYPGQTRVSIQCCFAFKIDSWISTPYFEIDLFGCNSLKGLPTIELFDSLEQHVFYVIIVLPPQKTMKVGDVQPIHTILGTIPVPFWIWHCSFCSLTIVLCPTIVLTGCYQLFFKTRKNLKCVKI